MDIISRLKKEIEICNYLIKDDLFKNEISINNKKLQMIKKIAKKINSENKYHCFIINKVKFHGSGYSKIEINKNHNGDYNVVIKRKDHINHRTNGSFISIKLSKLNEIIIDNEVVFNID